ncbi:DinB family protein [Brevibacillus ginsengisoli]|uniref:DinB family protein n=1 Tax=Brevibacillus ginsengisoli TaxID=363854 RepID=UPI003CF4BEA9
MYHTIREFVEEWKMESAATGRLMDALTDESLQQSITPDHRPLGQIAWHITQVIGSVSKEGYLEFEKPDGEELAPTSALKIASEYKKVSQALLHAVETQWTDATLQMTQDMHGEEWSNANLLHLLVQHEVHHRAQMTVLMRQAGLRPSGIYGPTRDDWMEKGQEPYL